MCSGDYLDDLSSADKSVYLVFEGRFIKIMLLIVYSVMALSCLSIMIVAVCIYRRHRIEDQEADQEAGD